MRTAERLVGRSSNCTNETGSDDMIGLHFLYEQDGQQTAERTAMPTSVIYTGTVPSP